jgi:hypothetical protein
MPKTKTKTKKPARKRAPPAPKRTPSSEPVRTPPAASETAAFESAIASSDLTLHELFQKQASAMLDRADLSDEHKQAILIGMSCPCCGAGGFSFTAKLRR